jgi:hypothetical protein
MEGQQMSECITTPIHVLLFVLAGIMTSGLGFYFLRWLFEDHSKYVVMRPDHGLYYCGLGSGNNTTWGSLDNAMRMNKDEAERVRGLFVSGTHYVGTVVLEVKQ